MKLFLMLMNGASVILGLISFLLIGFGLEECSGEECMVQVLVVIGVPLMVISMLVYFLTKRRLKLY